MVSNKRYFILVLICLIPIGCMIMFGRFQSFTYEKDYFSKIGITGKLHYQDIVTKLGEPLDTKVVSESESYIWKECSYNGFIVTFREEVNGSNRLMNVKITDPSYRLGKKNIGVGSSRLEVEKAYSKQERILDLEGLGFIDDLVWVEFEFDSNNEVNQIMIYYEP